MDASALPAVPGCLLAAFFYSNELVCTVREKLVHPFEKAGSTADVHAGP